MAFMTDGRRAMMQAWLPLLPGVAALMLVAGSDCLFQPENAGVFRQTLSLGAAGYLFTLAGLVFFGRRSAPLDGHARAAASLAVGLGLVCLSLWNPAWFLSPPAMDAAPGKGGNPFDPVNAMAAVLAVVLAVVTLVAQKSASDARLEAEKARSDILGALDIRLLAELTRLLALAQNAAVMAQEFNDNAESIAPGGEPLAKSLNAIGVALISLRKFLSAVHFWAQEPDLTSGLEVADTLFILNESLGNMESISRGVNGLNDQQQMLRRQFWHPITRSLEKLLVSLQSRATNSTVTTTSLLADLRQLRELLNTL